MDLNVILDATHEHIEKLMVKHVNPRRWVITYALQLDGTMRDVSNSE